MTRLLDVLVVSPSAAFASRLADAGPELRVDRVADADAALSRLAEADVVVCGDGEVSSEDAVKTIRAERDDVPVLAQVGEGAAADALLAAGATDVFAADDDAAVVANRLENAVRGARTGTDRDRMHQAVETALDGIALADASGTILYANEGFTDLHGCSADELVGNHWTDFYPESEQARVRAANQDHLQPGGVWTGEVVRKTPDGSTFPARVKVSRSEDGRYAVAVEDITEERERIGELERYERIVETSGAGIYTADAQGNIVSINDYACERLGYDREELVGMHTSELYADPADYARVYDHIESVAGGDEWVTTVETELVDAEGEPFPVELQIAPFDDEYAYTVGIARDITDRKRRERRLAESEARYRTIAETATDVIVTVDATGTIQFINDAVADVFGYDSDELEGGPLTTLMPERFEADHREAFARFFETGERTMDWSNIELPGLRKDGEEIDLSISFSEFELDGERHITGILRDVTDRKRRERALEGLETAALDLMHGHVDTDIAAEAASIGDRAFDPVALAVYTFDETAGALTRASLVTDREESPFPETATQEYDLLWTAFAEGDTVRESGTLSDGTAVERVVVPMGDHGVCCFAFDAGDRIDEAIEDVITVFVSTVEAAFDRAARERRIRERDERLEAQNERLEQLNHLNAVLRDVVRSLVSAEGEEVEQAVCDELAARDPYEFAWIAHYDPVEESLTPAVRSGVDADYLDHLHANVVGVSPNDPFTAAVETGEVQVVPQVMSSGAWDGIRQEALAYGYQSVAVVPLVEGERTVGVLAIHATDPDRFGGEERDVLAELGAAIATTVLAAERSKSFLTEDATHVEFAIESDACLYSRLTAELDCICRHEGLLVREDGTPTHFVTFEGVDADAVESFVADHEAVRSATVLATGEGQVLCELELADTPLFTVLRDHGGTLVDLVAERGHSVFTVELPYASEIRSFMADLGRRYPSVEFLTRRPADRTETTPTTFEERVHDALTDRQYEVLQVAYHGGFFDSPRRTTGADLAEALGISSPTFHHHLREAQRRIATELLG